MLAKFLNSTKRLHLIALWSNVTGGVVKSPCCQIGSQMSKLNTSYLTDSYIVFTLKMESVSKNTIFALKMMVKSGLEKNLFESPPCERLPSLTS